jgi:hypothetical protein
MKMVTQLISVVFVAFVLLGRSSAVDMQIFPLDLPMVDGVPANCIEMCSPIANTSATGCITVQCCTATFEKAYYECLSCVGHAMNVTDYTPAQNALDTLVAACEIRNFNDLPNLAFPGQDRNRTISTSALLASASSTFAITAAGPSPGPSTITALPPTNTAVTGSQQVTVTSTQPEGPSTSPSSLGHGLTPNIPPLISLLTIVIGMY